MRKLIELLQEYLDRAEDYLRHVLSGFRLRDPGPQPEPYEISAEAEYTDEALRALEEWKAAENYFNSIQDQDLVEYALYELEASRRKYEYLMRKLRNGDAAWERNRAIGASAAARKL